MEKVGISDEFVNLKATELRLGLPETEDGCEEEKQMVSCGRSNKRDLPETEKGFESSGKTETASPPKAQIVGWPPVRSYRLNNIQAKNNESGGRRMYVKVSMDGAPYLRKIDLTVYKQYPELMKSLENMFKFSVGEYFDFVLTYEDRDSDWMLVGDVPWEMFVSSCKRLRIMKGSEVKGLGRGVQ
ncbi:hypothetical protein Bca4012_060254 [Brassica carinata]